MGWFLHALLKKYNMVKATARSASRLERRLRAKLPAS